MKKQNNLLLKRPVGSEHVTVEWGDAPRLVIVHRHWLSRLCSRFFKTPSQTYLSLDRYGAFVWSHCDGNHTVGDIAERFRVNFAEDSEAVLERLIVFLRILLGKKLIALQD